MKLSLMTFFLVTFSFANTCPDLSGFAHECSLISSSFNPNQMTQKEEEALRLLNGKVFEGEIETVYSEKNQIIGYNGLEYNYKINSLEDYYLKDGVMIDILKSECSANNSWILKRTSLFGESLLTVSLHKNFYKMSYKSKFTDFKFLCKKMSL